MTRHWRGRARRTGLRAALLAGLLALGGKIAWEAGSAGGVPAAPAGAAPGPAARSTPAPARPAVAGAPSLPTADGPPGEPERIALRQPIHELDPETRARLQARLDRERAAEERFQHGVERSQVRGRDIDARVRDAFERVELVPEAADDGFIRGLRIRAVESGSALGEAGFREGDLLVQIDDLTLADPADLPGALARAGPRMSLCARRGSAEFCRELSLR